MTWLFQGTCIEPIHLYENPIDCPKIMNFGCAQFKEIESLLGFTRDRIASLLFEYFFFPLPFSFEKLSLFNSLGRSIVEEQINLFF